MINITKDQKGMAVIFKHEIENDTVDNPNDEEQNEENQVYDPYFKEFTVRFALAQTSKGLKLLVACNGED